MMTEAQVISYLNDVDPELETIRLLCELGSLIDGAGPHFLAHAVVLMSIIHTTIISVEARTVALLSEARACEWGEPHHER